MSHSVERTRFDEVMVPSYSPAQMIPVRGHGSRVWDQDNREYIDFAGGIAVNALGHCHPELVASLREQAGRLWHLSNVWTNEPAIELAALLCEKTFAERVFFANSGAEANEAAFKLARKYAHDTFGSHKHEIISFNQAFHGRTLFTVTVGGQAKYSEAFAPLPGGITHLDYNDCDALRAAVSDSTCAIVVELIQGEGGVLPADPEFIALARQLCDQHNALLIFDEIQTGVGRTGHLYAYQSYEVEPDILTTAKALGCGVPIGAMLTHTRIAQSLGVGSHGSTFGGNPLMCAVALKALQIISQPELLAGVTQRHQQFMDGLHQINQRCKIFHDIRGQGLLIGCELNEAWQGRSRDVLLAALEEGLMLLVAGPDVVRLTPSLIIPEQDIAQGLQRLEHALHRLLEQA